MAAKRPIVCLDAPAMNELVGHKEAYLFPYSKLKEERWNNGAIAQLFEYHPDGPPDVPVYSGEFLCR